MSEENKMDIYRCEALAKRDGFDSATFDLVGPGGRMKCKWLDAYFGFFRVTGEDGFMSVNDVPSNLWCENFEVPA